jgi:hypothetical protein
MKAVKKIPALKKEHFQQWADQIIEEYKLTEKTSLEIIIEKVAVFFDALFKNYQISFTDTHPDGIFPFAINRLDRKPKYADEAFYDELFTVENHIHWTYVFVLSKLYKDKECPMDTAECPY